MNSSFTSYRVVAAQELLDALRSRRALIFLVLYLVGAITASIIFINVLHRIEVQAVKAMGLTPSEIPGRTTEILWKSQNFRNMMRGLIDDRTLMDQLLEIPPVALFYAWLSFTFTPLLVVLLSSSRIAEEVESGAIRYSLVRTSRSILCLGKYTGQALLLLIALLCSAAGAWIAAAIRMESFEWGTGAVSLGIFSVKAWLYACVYLGLALGISQLVRSQIKATALGLFAMILLTVIYGLHHLYRETYRFADMMVEIIPQGHKMDLWYLDPAILIPAALMLVGLSFAYLLAGYAVFFRRDL